MFIERLNKGIEGEIRAVDRKKHPFRYLHITFEKAGINFLRTGK
jgi:hypothetical protein